MRLFSAHGKQVEEETIEINDLSDPIINEVLGESVANELREEIDMINQIYPPFDKEAYAKGELNPVFFWKCYQ